MFDWTGCVDGSRAVDAAKEWAVHDYIQHWAREGVFENIVIDASVFVEELGGYQLYECVVDGTFSKARGQRECVSATKAR